MNYIAVAGLGAATATAVVAAGAAMYLVNKPEPFYKDPSILLKQSIILEDGSHMSASTALEDYRWAYHPEATTFLEIFKRGMKVSGNGQCLGSRTGPKETYKWLTYREVYCMAHQFGAGLLNMGLETGDKTRIAIYSVNRYEWDVVDLACSMFSMVLVPLYDTLNLSGCTYVINHTEVETLVCDTEERVRMLLTNSDQIVVLKRIVCLTNVGDECMKLASSKNIEISHFAKVIESGQKNMRDISPPQPDDIFTICYTSGTTGVPKGVVVTHKNMITQISCILSHIELGGHIKLTANDRHLSYLPLAHMYERVVHSFVFLHGAKIGFFRGDPKLLLEDLQDLKPTFFFTVPRLVNRVYDKVLAGVRQSRLKSFLFRKALNSKKSELQRGIIKNNGFWDKIVFKKVAHAFGGCLRFVVVSSAPLSPDVLTFLRCSLGCVVVNAYGSSEVCGGCTCTLIGDTMGEHVGPPVPGVLIKLLDVPDMDYYANNNQGEVCVKSVTACSGYYNNPEKDAELLTKDGWVRMGDIGEWLPNGALKIIGRKKDIFKLSQGEYIAVEKIENVYMRSEAVLQVFVTGDSLQNFPVAIVVPDPEFLIPWAENKGLNGTLDELCSNDTVKDFILSSILNEGKHQNLCSFEQVKKIHLHAEPFSVADGLLTPTLKNRRPNLEKYFAETTADLYK